MTKLYLISPPKIEVNKFAEQLKLAFEGGGVAAFQLRLKDTHDEEILKAAEILLPICLDNDCAFILNDSPKLATQIGASGVHVGDEDGSVSEARKIVGDEMIIGASCYNSIDRAIEVCEEGANYVSFGAFFETKTKTPKAKAEIETLEKWTNAANIPACAIGGITPQNCKPLIAANADFLCVISYAWNHPESPKKAVEEFTRCLVKK